MKPRILLTGFGPFPGVPVNPTAILMEKIAAAPSFFSGAELKAVELETAYAPAREAFEKSANAFQPDVILSFGVASNESGYRLERVAANLDACNVPDVKGELREKSKIAWDGPDRYDATFPAEEIETALRAAKIPVRFSDSAGGYVCNHIFYAASHWAASYALRAMVGFVHVPDPACRSDWESGGYMTELETVAKLSLKILVQPGIISANRRP